MVNEPHMSRQGTALMMRARVVELDKKQQNQKPLLTTLDLQVQDLQELKTVLTAYLNKLQCEQITMNIQQKFRSVCRKLEIKGNRK